MSEEILATREIMWNIPQEFRVIMYLSFVVSLGFFFYGFYKKLLFISNGKPKSLIGKGGLVESFNQLNWGQFFKTIFLTGKVTRSHSVGFFHSLIYYGFVILWIATDVVAIHYDTPFKIFQGPLYIIISFLADFAGLMILMGIFLAYKRRYISKPAYLSATKPNQEKYMYGMLLSLVLIGYLIEGLRILGTGMPEGERVWAPIGYGLAVIFGKLNLSDSVLAFSFRSLWMLHMLNTMVFVASIPFSKFAHFFLIPIGALVTPRYRAANLNPMNFENENAETFGLGKISEMTMKNKLDLLSCVECGRCTEACPAHGAGKNLNPKTIITKARDLTFNGHDELWSENPIYSSNELDACTTCGACMEECPAHIEHVNVIMEAKRYKALTLGDIPPAAADAVNKIKKNGNPWGIAQEDRFNWAKDLDIPVAEAGKPIDYLYYVGCAGSYDSANQKVVRDTISLMKKANVSFAVIGKTEKCNGDPVRRFGDEYSFYEIAIENIAALRNYSFSKVVTHCPHCLHTIGKEYGKFEDGKFETIHHTELLAELIQSGKLTATKTVSEKFTFHDPCYLGRHHGQYNAPRAILNAIPGLQINEMERSKDKSLCCGMGGGNMWYELPEGHNLAKNRLDDVSKVDANKLATACSFCMINFNSSKGEIKKTENMEIEDIASILAKSVN
jgi:Fe-S oxidoreductase